MKKIELLMDAPTLDRTLIRVVHQILERNTDLDKLGIIGLQTRGVFLARRLANHVNDIEKRDLTAGVLDVTLYRDDYHRVFRQHDVQPTSIPFDINNIDIILVDDVLYTGRTVRAALDALTDLGRPRTIQLAALVDRGLREFPIRADYVGMEVKTRGNQTISLNMRECDGDDSLWLMQTDGNSDA